MAFIDPRTLPEISPKPGWRGRFFHGEHMTFAYYDLDEGASLHEHAHPNEEAWHVLDGTIELTLDGQIGLISAGGAAIIPPNTAHAIRVTRPSRVIVVDHPVRREIAGAKI